MRFMNDSIAEYGFDSDAAREFPSYLMYDIVNVCNARCAHCPQSNISKDSSFMPMRLKWEYYEKTIIEASKYNVDVVRITGDGEPLLHSDVVRMIALARQLGFSKINLTTNGSLLKDALLDALMKNPPHIFDISLDALWPESYKKVRAGLALDEVNVNIFRLLDIRDPEETKVLVSMIRRPDAADEVIAFEEYWRDKVDFVAIREMHTNLGATGAINVSTDKQRWPCQHLWQRLIVDYRGYIRYCPVDWQGVTKIGSVDEMSLFDAWHCSDIEALRESHLAGKFGECAVCRNCNDWLISPWDRGWLKMLKKLEEK